MAGLTFIPWLRLGLAGEIAVEDGTATAENRAPLAVQLTLDPTATVAPENPLRLLGPGDVDGIDPLQVLRTDPRDGEEAYEPSHFVAVDFDEPALLWAFTPTRATTSERLRPWISLIVVREQAGVALEPGPRPGSSLLRIEAPADPASELPDPEQAWASAHVQIAGPVADDLARVLADEPERTLSRLICTRALEPGARYLACVVPSFAAGRDAALGKVADPLLRPAWDRAADRVALPVYYSWRFGTGPRGSFAELAAQLEPGVAPPHVGWRRLSVERLAPGHGPLYMSGLLRAPGGFEPPPEQDVVTALAESVGELPEAVVTQIAESVGDAAPVELRLPLYGGAYAGMNALAADASGWLARVNLDPRRRVAAALGARVARDRQEELVAAAWAQLGDADRANAALDRGALAREATRVAYEQHLAPLDTLSLLNVTAPVQDRVRTSSLTLRALGGEAGAPDAVFSTAFARLIRPSGPIMRRELTGDSALASEDLASSPAAAAWARAGVGFALDRTPSVTQPPAANADVPLGRLRALLLDRLEPERTVPDRVRARIELGTPPVAAARAVAAEAGSAAPTASAPDPVRPTTFPISFPTPMFDDLAVVAPDYVLPNADAIPRNAVVALEPTHELIAAFLVGLNSELGRELVWRGFPVDRRTTFFARFWDHRGQSGGRDDIAPIGDWDPASLLAAGTAGGGSLILAVRGDLLLRYPRTLVYAVSAAPSPTGPVLPAPEHEEPRAPLFSGLVPPDIRFFGFDFGDDDPRSGQDDPGSFFVFQEQATEARFGAPAGGPLPLDGNSADVATAALRPAARVAIHADELLPR